MTPTTGEVVVELSDVGIADVARAGPKLARLGELRARGWRVPDGYVVTVAALRGSLPLAAREELRRLLDEVPDDPGALEGLSRRARALIEEQPLAPWLEDTVRAAHERLERRTGVGSELLVAVRSSAASEDGAAASFAGQFDTYLGVHGSAEVLRHVVRCWSSLYTSRALGYRRRHGLPQHSFDLAVGVLQLVDARSAGVVFTLDPVTGDRGVMVVEGSWGLGESVVSGRVTPDHWVVERASGRFRERRIANKRVQSAWDGAAGRVVEAAVPAGLCERPCLDDEEVRFLCRQAAAIESEDGAPQDVEWAIDRRLPFRDGVFVLQHRPETTWASPPSPPPDPDPRPYDPVEYALRNVFKVPDR